MPHNLSLSTVWNGSKHTNATALLDEIRALGFQRIELNFQMTADIVRDIARAVDAGDMTVSSVHNYCPVPEGVSRDEANPDQPSLASTEEHTRREAVRLTKHSIETARRLKAPAVVIHAGRVDIEARTRKLIALYNTKGPDSKEFVTLRAEAIDDRRHHVKEHFDALLTSVSELVPYAREKAITLGIENRFYHRELPLPEELEKMFHYFPDRAIGYWHDTGHAFIMELLGFYPLYSYLDRFHNRLVGIHLHDVKELHDHFAPFQGGFDWTVFKRYNTSPWIKVIEVHPFVSSQEIITAVERLNAVGLVRS